MKKIVSVVLVAIMLLSLVPFYALGVTYETDANGVSYEKKSKFNGSETTYYYTLADCPENATSVTIPETFNGLPVSEIKSDAFASCNSITSIHIPKSITTIKNAAISSCASLVELTVDSENSVYYSQGNCILEKETNKIAVGCKASVIPTDAKVTTIGEYAFYRCSGITKIVNEPTTEAGALYIPGNITVIENAAFCLCPNLVSAEFSIFLITIDDYAFQFCDKLEVVKFGSSLETIGDYCFNYCDSLPEVVIPESVTTIGNNAFYPCESLADVYFKAETLPENLGDQWSGDATVTEVHTGFTSIDDDSYNTSGNVALGKSYDAVGFSCGGDWPADYTANLTDGKASKAVTFDNNWFAFSTSEGDNGVNAPNGVGSVIIDLNGSYDITSIKVNTAVGTDIQNSGVNGAAKISAYISDSATGEFTYLGDLTAGEINNDVAWASLFAEATGRYVKIEVTLNGSFAFINEVAVYGTATDTSEPSEYVLGDLNYNKAVDTMDYIISKRIYFGTFDLNSDLLRRGDMNNNGTIETMDYILLKRLYFGTIAVQ